jgi:hypothetical protein
VGHILPDKRIDVGKGVLVGGGIEIEGSAEKMAGRVGEEELLGRGRLTADLKENAGDASGVPDDGILDGTGFDRMLKGHLIGVIPQPVKTVVTYFLVADIDTSAKTGEVNIYPVGILGYGVKIAAVPDDTRIDRVLKCIGEIGAIERLVLMGRKVDFKITSSLGGVPPVAGKQCKKGQKKCDRTK